MRTREPPLFPAESSSAKVPVALGWPVAFGQQVNKSAPTSGHSPAGKSAAS